MSLTTMTDSNNFKIAANLAGQLPYRLLKCNPSYCEWLQNTQENFTEPFFDETISRLKYSDENRRPYKMLAHIDMLTEWAEFLPQAKPTAIIFHISRCGSTLFSQLLSLQQQNMVLAEVPFFDELLRLPFKNSIFSKEITTTLLNAAIKIYGNSSHNEPQHLFIKADSWHLHFYEQLRALYPGTPFILLYRNPLQVMFSQQKRRGIQSVPGMIEPQVFGFDKAKAEEYDLDKYMANVLQTYFEKMISIAANDKASILINYNEGALKGMEKIMAGCHVNIDDDYRKLIESRAGYHAKYPQQIFEEDNKQDEVAEYMQRNMALYQQLDAMRLNVV
ncbi:MAG: hypothetical protein EOO03_04130 [Chitinophagaceae bacterium]|nr:MAG: hypothetical protein EOO03_04130 [Chitinophagaceae bacterium]